MRVALRVYGFTVYGFRFRAQRFKGARLGGISGYLLLRWGVKITAYVGAWSKVADFHAESLCYWPSRVLWGCYPSGFRQFRDTSGSTPSMQELVGQCVP